MGRRSTLIITPFLFDRFAVMPIPGRFHETQALRVLCQRKVTVPFALKMRKGVKCLIIFLFKQTNVKQVSFIWLAILFYGLSIVK